MTPAAGQPHLRRSSWHEGTRHRHAAGAPLVGGRNTKGREERTGRREKQSETVGRRIIGA